MSDKIVYRDCTNWSNNDHCAKTKCNYCTANCKDYYKLKGRPMAEKNALAELAERLKWLCGEVYCTIGHDEADDIRKAQRIVSELAKANPDRWPMCVQVVIDCRAIAEEGASDGAKH